MRILIVSQYCAPEPIPKPLELAQALRDQGHIVDVITGFPNYPSGDLYEGYSLRLVDRETIDGIRVIRTFEYPYHGQSAIRRIVNYVSFMLSAPLGSLWSGKHDVIYVWHPPLTVGVAAWLISIIKRAKFVYDVQDIWPESAVLAGMISEGPLVRLMSRLERFVYSKAAHLLVPTDGARRNLIGKGVASEKVTVLPHWVDEAIFDLDDEKAIRQAIRKQMGWEGKFIVLFAGNLGFVQGLETVIDAASHLRGEDVVFVLMGDGASRQSLEKQAEELTVGENVQFIGRKPMSEVPGFMAAADALLVHLRASELSKLILPSKTMAYLAAGRPVLMAMEGAAADLVERAGCGIVFEPDDPRLLALMARKLRSLSPEKRAELGRKGRDYLREELTRGKIIPRYEEILGAVATSR